MNLEHIVTSFEIPHYKVVKTIGVVQGISVRSRSLIGSIGSGIETMFGGNISSYTRLCEKTRQVAFEKMIDQAKELGANGIIGFRYDANEIAVGVTEVLAYGTAVVLQKITTAS